MELGILLGLSVLGYRLNGKGRQQRLATRWLQPGRDPNRYPFQDDSVANDQLRAEDRSLYERRFQASLDPRTSGIVPPNMRQAYTYDQRDLANSVLSDQWAAQGIGSQPGMVPFFGSGRAMNSNDGVKQTLLEQYTGAIDSCTSQTGNWKPKREQAARFDPSTNRQAVTSGGTTGNPVMVENPERFYVSGQQNNTGPTDGLLVGPGLGIGPDVPATGGFHPYFRVLPPNVGGYKKNNLPARTVPGKALVQNAGQQAPVQKNRPQSFWEDSRYPTAPGRAAATAQMAPPNYSTEKFNPQRSTEAYSGTARAMVPAGDSVQAAGTWSRNKPDDCNTLPMINMGARGSGIGAYQSVNYSADRFDSGRESCYPNNGPAAGVGALQGGYQGAAGTQDVGPTIRQSTIAPARLNVGNPIAQGGQQRLSDPQRVTNRQTTTAPTQTLNAGIKVPAPMRHGFAYGQEANQITPSKAFTQMPYTPGGGSSGLGQVYNPGVGGVGLRSDANCLRAGNFQAPNVTYTQPGETTRCMNKVQVESYYPAPDLRLASKQLSNNPYNVKGWS